MTYLDSALCDLFGQIEEKAQLTAREKDLQGQLLALREDIGALEVAAEKEQRDVDRLENGGLAALFYQFTGKMEEKLDEEREEAEAAQARYRTAQQEAERAEWELNRVQARLAALAGCEVRYEAALQEKAGAIRAAGGEAAQELARLEERYARQDRQQRELQEAIGAGRAAGGAIQALKQELEGAEGWGTWDLVGGGLLADLAKHEHLDKVRGMLPTLTEKLKRFRSELADVTIDADIELNVDGFLRFADFFFDGLFADWAVMDEIHRSQEQVDRADRQVCAALERLDRSVQDTAREQDRLKQEMDRLVRETVLG